MKKDVAKHKLRKMLERLSEYRGRNTELVSLYIPAGYPMPKVSQLLTDEASTAANIKSKSTRKNVLAALEKISQHLKLYNQTPENGLVIFCGNVSPRQGTPDYELFSLEPPEPISTRLYRCDQEFVLDPLKELVEEKDIYGLLIMERNEATIGKLKGKRVEQLDHMTSGVPGKTRAGGQSAARFERLREQADHEFRVRVGKHFNNLFLDKLDDLKGILVGGPGLTKEKFLKGDFLDYRLQEKVINAFDTVYTEEYGLRELVDKASDTLQKLDVMREKKIMQKFFEKLKNEDRMVAYGEEEVTQALTLGAVEDLLLSEALNLWKVTLSCSCGYEESMTKTEKEVEELEENLSNMPCPECNNAQVEIAEKKELEDELSAMADNIGAEVHFISTETEEGTQLYEAFGGIAAVLRFQIR